MAQVVPDTSPGKLLLTPDAPYSVYLRALGSVWDEARDLGTSLHHTRRILESCRAPRTPQQPIDHNLSSAAVIDIRPGQIGNEVVVVARLDKDEVRGEHTGTINSDAVNGFMDSLRHCTASTHTRMIVLQDSVLGQFEGISDIAIELLFKSHLLGSELGLTPAYVSYLSQNGRGQSFRRLWWHMRTYPSLTFGQSCKTAKIALYLGRRSFGDGYPHTSECM
jgi:hypothetical protein